MGTEHLETSRVATRWIAYKRLTTFHARKPYDSWKVFTISSTVHIDVIHALTSFFRFGGVTILSESPSLSSGMYLYVADQLRCRKRFNFVTDILKHDV